MRGHYAICDRFPPLYFTFSQAIFLELCASEVSMVCVKASKFAIQLSQCLSDNRQFGNVSRGRLGGNKKKNYDRKNSYINKYGYLGLWCHFHWHLFFTFTQFSFAEFLLFCLFFSLSYGTLSMVLC